ncbi:MAG: hypothetical protein ABEJ83_01305, partial [Candidatus Nanohaloarchaea archaeon]
MKGISNVISSVLILALLVSIAGIYAKWAPAFSEKAATEVASNVQSNIKCRNAGISLENASYDLSGNLLEYRIRNTGTIRLSDDIHLYTLTDSSTTNKTVIPELSVGETYIGSFKVQKTPDLLVASSK